MTIGNTSGFWREMLSRPHFYLEKGKQRLECGTSGHCARAALVLADTEKRKINKPCSRSSHLAPSIIFWRPLRPYLPAREQVLVHWARDKSPSILLPSFLVTHYSIGGGHLPSTDIDTRTPRRLSSPPPSIHSRKLHRLPPSYGWACLGLGLRRLKVSKRWRELS